MNNPITFLIGAGASFPYGVPMMVGFYREFREYLDRRHHHCFEFLTQVEQRAGHAECDLENLLSDLQSILSVERGLTIVGRDQGEVQEQISLARELRGYLDAFVIDRCERFDREKVRADFRSLLDLRQHGPLWVFSTNYDRILEFACEAHGISWSDGFDTAPSSAVAEWTGRFDADVRIVKLHGSVNWYEDDPGRALHRLDRGYSLPAHDFRLLRGTQQLRPLMIIPTLEKEALGDPYIGLAIRLTDVLLGTKVLVVAGNSLRDRHVQAYIRERMGGLHVLIVSPTAGRHRDILGTPARTHALNAGFSEFVTLGGSALQTLAQSIANADTAAVGTALEQFVTSVSQDVADSTTISLNPALQRIWGDLDAASTPLRVEAVKQLANHPHPAVTRRLKALLQTDPSPPVRVAVIDCLFAIDGEEAIESIGNTLVNDAVPDVRIEAALALGRSGSGATAREWLQRGLDRAEGAPALRSIIERQLAVEAPAL